MSKPLDQLSDNQKLEFQNRAIHKPFSGVISKIKRTVKKRLFGDKPNASVSFRYFCKNVDKEWRNQGTGIVIAITSTKINPKLSANTALLFSYSLAKELNNKVLIVDTHLDIERSSISSLLGGFSNPGFLQLATEDSYNFRELLKPTSVESVFFLPSGAGSSSVDTMLNRNKLAALIQKARSEFDNIVLFQGDIAMDTRYMALSELADLNLMLVEENRTLMSEIQDRKRLYEVNEITDYRIVLIKM